MQLLKSVMVLLLAAAVAGCATKGPLHFEPDNFQHTPLSGISPWTCAIQAAGGWQSTGITVQEGSTIRISASGTVQLNGIQFPDATPQGVSWFLDTIYKDWRHGALLGRVG